MEQLWINLPALAPDYSGVCSAMFDLGGISVIHDASGCTGNYTGYDEPRWYGSTAKVFSSGLREIDAVLGRDDRLIDNILEAGKKLNPTLYTVIGSPVPMVIGTDMTGVAHEIEERSGIPSFGFDMNGLGLYNKGVSEAMCALVKKFTKSAEKKVPKGINILGTTPLDLSANSNADDLAEQLEEWGFTVLGRMMMGATVRQVEQLSQAEVNLVVTQSGLGAAKLLKNKYGIPYVVGMPLAGQMDVKEALEATIEDGETRIICDEVTDESQGQVDTEDSQGILIVAEQVLANSIRRAIKGKNPHAKVTVGTLFGLNRQIAAKDDINIPGEETLTKVINSKKYKILVGDPLFEDLIYGDNDMKLVSLSHVAVSSKLYWNEAPRLLKKDMQEMLEQIYKL